jgi:hypothetical protein
MGVYAQTEYQIVCKSNKVAKEVLKAVKEMKEDEMGNEYPTPKIYDNQVEGFLCSGRIQNLEYRCEQVWDKVKGIKGVEELNCPFLSEADGMYFTNENENEKN